MLSFLAPWLLCIGCLPTFAFAQCQALSPNQIVPLGYETQTVADTALPLSAATYQTATYTAALAVLTVETAPIRFKLVGTVPTSTDGQPLPASTTSSTSSLMLCGIEEIRGFRMIRSTGVSAVVNTYYARIK